MKTFLQDLRYGARLMGQKPGFTAVALLALALGIGANSAIFSVVNAVLFRPLSYKDPDRLVTVSMVNLSKGLVNFGASMPDFREWKTRNRSFEQTAAYWVRDFNISGGGEPERVDGATVSSDLFPLLGASPAAGRAFTPDEEVYGNHQVATISHGLWQRRFGSDPNIVGQKITLNGLPYTVVGVMPQGFQFPNPGVALWTPLAVDPESEYNTRGNYWLKVIARLNPGVTVSQAQSDMTGVTEQIKQEVQAVDFSARVTSLREATVSQVEPALYVLLGAVGLVLLIACANVANMLLARSAGRQREIAIRAALGASRVRLVRQLLTESLLLGLSGGAAGVLLAVWGLDALIGLSPENLPRLGEARIDAATLLFTLAISVVTSLLFGLAPVLQIVRPRVNESLKEGGRGMAGSVHSRRIRSTLIAAEVALSLVLLICAGLLIGSFWRLTRVNPGFRPDNVLTMSIALPESQYPEQQPERTVAFYSQLLERVHSLPGVESAAVTTSLPLTDSGWGKMLTVVDRPEPTSIEQVPIIQYRQVSEGYFRTLGIAVAQGRGLIDQDRDSRMSVAVVNETFVKKNFPDEDPIGRKVYLGPPQELIPPGILPPGFRFPQLTIVGVIRDVKHEGLAEEVHPELFSLHGRVQDEPSVARTLFLAVHTKSDPLGLVPAVRSQVYSIDNGQPVANVMTMDGLMANSLARQRFSTLLLGLFAGVALALAAVGLYGVMSFVVAQRTQEIGIRIALGASRADVLRLVIGQGMLPVLVGLAFGLGGSFAAGKFLASLLYGVSATDALTYVSVSLLLIIVALVACAVPARRAMKVDPMVALRYE